MLTSKHKEAVMEVRRHLVEAATKEKLPIKMSMGKHVNATWDGYRYRGIPGLYNMLPFLKRTCLPLYQSCG